MVIFSLVLFLLLFPILTIAVPYLSLIFFPHLNVSVCGMCKNMNSFVSFKICDKDFSVSLIFSVKLTSVPLSTVPYKKLIACFTGC